MADPAKPVEIFIIAGEASGDQIAARLMAAISRRLEGRVHFAGIGGQKMSEAGMVSLFPLTDIAVMGLAAVFAGLPRILRRIGDAERAVIASRPDLLVIVDSPDFTHRVARRVRRALPDLPIVDYVSPTVWAWRPGRARTMRAYIDHVMALLPFEPDVYRRLDGPQCSYVGHPLIEHLDEFRPAPGERPSIGGDAPPVLLVLPGSRGGEIKRHMEPFGIALEQIRAKAGPFELVLPTFAHLAERIAAAAAGWPVQPNIVIGEAEKLASFRRAHAALAASGTVTLELALAGVPMAVGYEVDWLVRQLHWLATTDSIVLPNLILGENVIPEFVLKSFSPEAMAAAVVPLLSATRERQLQLDAFARLDGLMALPGGQDPSDRAAEIVLSELPSRT